MQPCSSTIPGQLLRTCILNPSWAKATTLQRLQNKWMNQHCSLRGTRDHGHADHSFTLTITCTDRNTKSHDAMDWTGPNLPVTACKISLQAHGVAEAWAVPRSRDRCECRERRRSLPTLASKEKQSLNLDEISPDVLCMHFIGPATRGNSIHCKKSWLHVRWNLH